MFNMKSARSKKLLGTSSFRRLLKGRWAPLSFIAVPILVAVAFVLVPGSGGAPTSFTVPKTSAATANVDGRVTGSDGYVQFASISDGTNNFGALFFTSDTAFFYFAARLNALNMGDVANENVYGSLAYHDPAPTGYDTGWNNHNFGHLKNSDRARFQIACDGTIIHDFVQDYLREDGSSWASDTSGDGSIIAKGPSQSASSLEWNLEHQTSTASGGTGWGDDAGEDPEVESPPFDAVYPTFDSEFDGWVWEMTYEFSLTRSQYSGCSQVTIALVQFAGETSPIGGMHNSPSKEGGESIITTPTDVPFITPTPGDTPTPTDTPVDTPTPTDTPVDTPTPTDTPGDTPTPTDTPEGTPTPTDTPGDTPTPTDTPEGTPTPTDTPGDTPTPTDTPEGTPTPTDTPGDTPTPTDTPEGTPTSTDTPGDTPTPTNTVAAATATPVPPTVTATFVSEVLPTVEATPTNTPEATPTPPAAVLPPAGDGPAVAGGYLLGFALICLGAGMFATSYGRALGRPS